MGLLERRTGRLWGLILVVLALVAPVVGTAAPAEPRVALVIGNAAYPGDPLRNPVNDAREMARTLRGLGFTVLLHENVGKRAMEDAMLEFGRRIAEGGVGLFFYAGHGMQVRGRNYLVPVDARIQEEAATRVAAVDVDLLLEQLSAARNRVNIVILDACRNNPFEQKLRGGSQGLAAVDAARGTLVAYATSPGSVAIDGQGQHGLYTEELLKALRQPGLKIEEVFKRVRIQVTQRSKGSQTPWESSSLTGDLVVNIQVNLPAEPTVPATADRDALFWASIKDSKAAGDYEAYLRQFPNGTFAELAQQRIKGLAAAGPALPAAPSLPTGPAATELAAPAAQRSRFDGLWDITVVCADTRDGAQGYTLTLVGEVRDGQLLAQLGTPGRDGSLHLAGGLAADGSALLLARGRTADPRFAVERMQRGTPYQYRVEARFDERAGVGKRLDLRPCDLRFARR